MDDKRYLTVTALTKYIKYKFDQDAHLKNVLLKGEISNFKHHSRGHFYFTLKDEKAQISAIMFASNSKKVPFQVQDGMSVLVEGNISVYESSGNYQIYVQTMTEDGLGNLYVAYEQLKKKLSEEGLFDDTHKQPIPRFPKTIAVLTSPTGAAVRDIIHIVNRRFPLTKIIIYPTLVQGEYAKDNIVQNIEQVNRDQLADVIILGRGGGSIEDLWPFNEEQVAYAIYKSMIPIISSVGHETDFTISDFVADLRAPTPSGGAEIAVPNQVDIVAYINQMNEQMRLSLKRLLDRKKQSLTHIKSHYIFQDPLRLTEHKNRRLDHLVDKLSLLHPGKRLEQAQKDTRKLTQQLIDSMKRIYKDKEYKYHIAINKLDLVNPLHIMKKGYTIVAKDGEIIKSVSQLDVGEHLTLRMNDGVAETTVTSVRKDKDYE
ncbi:exodeoxyribonuclease VII large subunit [Candidatus Xianfuyuplasma coldseepsis]|uniref:Exodeoxyribonuclease 7 large subunit n=1 Tax=Candidatus Xianfuyuplasma coldseepsis TaxID=2782163 RepID=A0A7L7KSV4_9MOLU|nr:exodeoxyribonuclease VII large subunit [Xianfuyuplasma coldseepsis]QMS85685.1 exodeoxyribonuclease VII large subunit [Xianfuyuplasma coldseepsis]